jgi:ABC-2 type transport system permease protein
MSREGRFYVVGALVYAVVLELLLVAAIVYWSDFEDSIDTIRNFLPGSLKGVADGIQEGGVATYVHAQHFFKGCNALGILAAVVFAAGAVAGEAHRGTLEIWLARPVSRRRLLLERYAYGALGVTVPVFATTLSIPPLLGLQDISMDLGPLMLGAAHQSIFLLAVYSVTFLASCLATQPLVVAFGVLVVGLLQFLAYIVPTVTHWSLFRLADIDVFARIGATHALDLRMIAPLVAANVVLIVASLRAFERRTP